MVYQMSVNDVERRLHVNVLCTRSISIIVLVNYVTFDFAQVGNERKKKIKRIVIVIILCATMIVFD